LKRDHRLTERSQFQQIRRNGNCWSDRLLVICVLPNGLPISRFGFSVSKRVGRAVVRNRVRRRASEVVRLRLLDIVPGYDVVFIAKVPIAQAAYTQIESSIERLLHLANLITAASENV